MPFVRRFSAPQPTAVLTAIEGIVLIDAPPPGTFAGIIEGVACVVGEFDNLQYACSVDGSGNVTSNAQPVQIFTGADMLQKLGGFNPSLGDFGNSDGNGFVALRNK